MLKTALYRCGIVLLIILMLVTGCNGEWREQAQSPQYPPGLLDLYTESNLPTSTPDAELDSEPEPTPEPTPEPPPPLELVRYQGMVYHIFFHFLIAFPEIAFAVPYGRDLDRDTVTPSEFWQALEELYRNNFVLIDINDTVTICENGGVSRKPYLMLPEGTRPLILSFDDINYYSRNLGMGTVDKIVLDDNGRLATSTRMPDGSIYISRGNCIVPLLEKFVEQHPGFSPFGAMGTLALTGFDGILGYRTQGTSPNRESEIAAVKPIAEALLQNGWNFASHSFGHRHMNNRDLEFLQQDTRRWDEEVRPLVGDTIVYVFPFGDYPRDHSDPRFQYLLTHGFRIMCGVGVRPHFVNRNVNYTYVFMDRANIDGFTLRNRADMFYRYFGIDVSRIYNPEERVGPALVR